MFENFNKRIFNIPDDGFGSASINARIGGDGPPLLLIHGNPLTHV